MRTFSTAFSADFKPQYFFIFFKFFSKTFYKLSFLGVLVTGASGYVATHCVQQLLEEGYLVRGTVRSLKSDHKIKPILQLANGSKNLELVEADLTSGDNWEK